MATTSKRVFALPAKLKRNKDYYRYSPYSKNLLAVFEDCLFIWHAIEEQIVVITLTENNSNAEQEPQILTLSCSPAFTVEDLKFNSRGHHLALSGRNGLLVIELPRRWGSTHFRGPGFEGGKDVVLCKSWRIAQRFLSCNTKVQLCHVGWYPGCPSASHLLFLCTDNYLRMYNIGEPQTPVACIPICPDDYNRSSLLNTSESHFSFPNIVAALGETAVSFDFGPSYSSEEDDQKRENTFWPVFILKGNGDVCLINSNMNNMRGRGPRVQGPLTIHPPAEDNYGADACSIICLQILPPVLVISTCAGIIYHCIALRNITPEQNENSDNEQNETWSQLIQVPSAEMDLYVYESVELSTSLTQPNPEDELFSCPIRLSPDPVVVFRYHCTHSAGVHAVALPLVLDIEKFATKDDLLMDTDAVLRLFDTSGRESVVEHLVCTQPFPSSPASPVLGLAISSTTAGASLICLLASWDALQLPLSFSYSYLHCLPSLPSDELNNTKELDSGDAMNVDDSFLSGLLTSFQGSVHTPLLKTDFVGPDPSPQKCIELLGNVTQSLREDRIQRLQIAHTQMQKRIKMLQRLKVQMLSGLETIRSEQNLLRDKAEALAERYEDVCLTQQQITEKVENALSMLQRRLPVLSDAEVAMQKELYTTQEKLKHMANLMEQAQLKLKFRTDIEKVKSQQRDINRESSDYLSGSNKMTHVKELITQQSTSVASLVKKVNFLMKEMGL